MTQLRHHHVEAQLLLLYRYFFLQQHGIIGSILTTTGFLAVDLFKK
jgi:hypothetical protein